MKNYEHNVHNFVNRFDIVPRILGNSAAVKLLKVCQFLFLAFLCSPYHNILWCSYPIQLSSSLYLQIFAGTKGDVGMMMRCGELSSTDFVLNLQNYQPYGEFYFLYHEPFGILRIIKPNTLLEKRVILTLPVTLLPHHLLVYERLHCPHLAFSLH